MGIYILLFAVIWISYPFFKKSKKDNYLFFMLLLVFLLMALRDFSVGTDIENYITMYKYNDNLSLVDTIKNSLSLEYFMSDPMYSVYCVVLNTLGVSERGFLVVTSLLPVLSVYIFFKRFSNNYRVSLFVFGTIGLFPMFMSALRQSLAMAVMMIAYKYLVEKKPLKYYLLTIIAILFHASAIIMLPAYLIVVLLQKKKPEVSMLYGIIGGIICSMAFSTLFGIVGGIGRFDSYMSGTIYRTNPILIFMYLAIGIICVWLNKTSRNDINEEEKLVDIHFIMYAIGFALLVVSLENTMISRFSTYYFISMPIILSNAINRISDWKNRLSYEVVCCVLLITFFLYTTPGSVYGIGKYMFYWS